MNRQSFIIENYLSFGSGNFNLFFFLLPLLIFLTSCEEGLSDRPQNDDDPIEEEPNPGPQDGPVEGVDYFLPDIDLSNWKVTLPIPREDGRPLEVTPPEILSYASNVDLLPFMYNDSTDGSLVFYTYPGSSTANSSYSRTELREQMEPGSNNVNWTFGDGGRMKGKLSVPDASTDSDGDFHRIIIMQIHGRLTNEQRDLIGEDDNNAPPVLKIYWDDGKVRVKTKVLKDLNAAYEEILHTSAWGDDEGRNFSTHVGHDAFTLEIIVSEGRMEVTLNDDETFVYEDIHMEKWGVFENYFKAGNYLTTRDEGAFSKVKYYELQVWHD